MGSSSRNLNVAQEKVNRNETASQQKNALQKLKRRNSLQFKELRSNRWRRAHHDLPELHKPIPSDTPSPHLKRDQLKRIEKIVARKTATQQRLQCKLSFDCAYRSRQRAHGSHSEAPSTAPVPHAESHTQAQATEVQREKPAAQTNSATKTQRHNKCKRRTGGSLLLIVLVGEHLKNGILGYSSISQIAEQHRDSMDFSGVGGRGGSL